VDEEHDQCNESAKPDINSFHLHCSACLPSTVRVLAAAVLDGLHGCFVPYWAYQRSRKAMTCSIRLIIGRKSPLLLDGIRDGRMVFVLHTMRCGAWTLRSPYTNEW
jgi:hypothetical protein